MFGVVLWAVVAVFLVRASHSIAAFPEGWQPMPAAGAETSYPPAAILFDGKVYVFAIGLFDVWIQIYDPATGEWLFQDTVATVPGPLPFLMRWLAVTATADRLYLFAIDITNTIFSTSKQAGSAPLEGWDGSWEWRSFPIFSTEIYATRIGGQLYLIQSDGGWTPVDPAGGLLW
jgi:hypothetical protein